MGDLARPDITRPQVGIDQRQSPSLSRIQDISEDTLMLILLTQQQPIDLILSLKPRNDLIQFNQMTTYSLIHLPQQVQSLLFILML